MNPRIKDLILMLFSFFILLFSLICFTACRGVKVSATVETKKTDSTVIKEIKSVEYEGIPSAQASLKIPVSAISQLPAGSGYFQTVGRASLGVTVQNDTVYVNAICDSLQRRIEYYEMSLQQMRTETEKRLKTEKRNGVQTAFKWCLTGVLTGFGITVFFTKIIKKIKS
jgi:hypothetical protein